MRDLAGDVKVNLKHMIEDSIIDSEKKTKGNKKKGKKRPKLLTGGKPGRALGKKSSQGQADGPGP